MLAFFRRRMKAILWVLVVVVIVTFIPWGVGVRLRSGGEGRPAGELFGRPVSREEFNDAYMATVVTGKLSGFPLDAARARQMAWERLIYLTEARRRGISVSDGELARAVRAQFGGDGAFDPARYESLIRNIAGVPADLYEGWLRESMMIRKMSELAMLSAWLPDPEIARRYREAETRLRIRFALMEAAQAEKSVAVSDEEVRERYEARLAEFKTPTKVAVRCLMAPWAVSAEEPAVTDEEVRAYYDAHPEEFAHGKRLKARQILFKIEGKDPAEAEKKAAEKAEKVLEKLRAGGAFAKLAQRHSADEKTASKGGDLGFVERHEMPKELSDALFALEAGAFGGPVRTAQGLHLIAVDETQEPGTKPLDEVRDRIRSRLQRDKKERLAAEEKEKAYRRVVDASLALVDTPDLEAVARAKSLELMEIGPFAEGEVVKEIGPSMDFSKAAFDTEVGAFSDIVELPGRGYCVVVPKERIAARTLPLEEVRTRIVADLTAEKGRLKAREEAARLHGEVQKRMAEKQLDFAAACGELSIKTEESGTFTARGPVEGLGAEPAIAAAAAALKPGELGPVLDTANGSCLFALVSREEPTEEEIAKGMARFRDRARREEEGRFLAEWNRRLHEQARKVDYLDSEEDAAGD